MSREKDNTLKTALNNPLKEVAVVQGPVEAEVIKSLLTSHNIPCLLMGQVVQSVHAFSADGLGKIKVMVAEHDYADAQRLLRESKKE